MFRDLLYSRTILAGLVFFVVIVGAAQLDSWHVKRTTAAETERAKQATQAREDMYKRRMAKKTNVPTENKTPGFVGVPKKVDETQNKLEVTATQTSPKADNGDVADTIFSNEIPTEAPANVRVSPHGFGAYPPIPEGAPIADFDEDDSVEMELMLRVAVKKWNEGRRFVGAVIENGKVYLNYPNTIYVRHAIQTAPNGEPFHYYSDVLGDVELTPEQMERGEAPPGVNVIGFDSEGLDPYEVLGLSR